jgi:hypothetical protein
VKWDIKEDKSRATEIQLTLKEKEWQMAELYRP